MDSKKAVVALSALVNGTHHTIISESNGGGGNGLRINGPTSIGWFTINCCMTGILLLSFTVASLKEDVLSTSPAASVRKLNYPLTPSSDTSDSAGNHLSDTPLSSVPGESGDSVDKKPVVLS